MRITGGQYKGHKLLPIKGDHIRPTSDKLRQAIFNILTKYGLPNEASVLDLFCGTGVLGLESLSRGAKSCVFIDKSSVSLDICKKNARILNLSPDSCLFIRKDALKIVRDTVLSRKFHLIFADPPYRKNLASRVFDVLGHDMLIKGETLCVIECEKEWAENFSENYEVLDSRIYGDSKILFCRFIGK